MRNLFIPFVILALVSTPTFAGHSLKGGGIWSNNGYSGSWDVTLNHAGDAVIGKVEVGGSNSCDGFSVAGKIDGSTVTFRDTKGYCGSWDVTIPLKDGKFSFSPDSGNYSGVSIDDFQWKTR